MKFDPVSYAIGAKSGGGGGGVAPVSGTVSTVGTKYFLTIPAPSGVDFSKYNRIVVWAVETSGVVWATESNMFILYYGATFPVERTFSADSIEISCFEAGKQFYPNTYYYVAWYE